MASMRICCSFHSLLWIVEGKRIRCLRKQWSMSTYKFLVDTVETITLGPSTWKEAASVSTSIKLWKALYDVRTEVHNYRDESRSWMQDLTYKVELILEWCESIAISLWLPTLLLLEGIFLDVLIHVPGSVAKELEEAPQTKGVHHSDDVQDGLGHISPWKP